MEEKTSGVDLQGYSARYIEIVQKVIMAPGAFYREMPLEGGLVDPIIFMAVMGALAGVLRAVLGVFGLGIAGSFAAALLSIIIVPVFSVIFGFIGAGVLFVIWKAMGSRHSFEVSFRCIAYATAISPVTAVFNVIPYIGAVLGLLWMTYILVNASTEVHRIAPKLAWIVFGAICAVFSITSISAQMTARNMQRRLGALQNQMGQINQMDPEQAGKALGEFMKGVQKGSK